jgi:subtilisin family serine protease
MRTMQQLNLEKTKNLITTKETQSMSNYIEEQLKASSIAQVIVVLHRPSEAAAAANSFGKHFHLAETAPQTALAESLAFRKGGGGRVQVSRPPAMRVYEHLGIMLGMVDKQGLTALRADKKNISEVISAPIFSLIRPHVRLAAASPKTTVTWGVAALEAPLLWKQEITGKGVLVGHLDTGADSKHLTLKSAIADFAEFDMMGNIVSPSPAAHDSDEHGTHTAATIAGRPVKIGGKASCVGVAPGAKLVVALVIEGGDVIARILGGMNWAVGKGVKVLSMSLGIRGYNADFRPVTQILRQKGILPVFAVGNEGPGTSRSPGNYPEALSVGAMDRNRLIADFSSSQRFSRPVDPLVPDLIGPGVDVISAKPGGGYQSMDGTSMATPHIAGLAALLFQAKPSATPDEVEQAILASCQGGPGLPHNRANRGFPNAPRALAKLLS